MRVVPIFLLALLATGCPTGQEATPNRQPSPTAPSPTATEPTESPSPAGVGLEQAFTGVRGVSFEDVPRPVARSHVRPIEASIEGVGRIRDVLVKEGTRRGGGPPVIATIAAIEPVREASVEDVFGVILAAASTQGELSQAAGGQAFLIEGSGTDVILSPIAVEPALLLLMVAGPKEAPGEEVAEAILAANSP